MKKIFLLIIFMAPCSIINKTTHVHPDTKKPSLNQDPTKLILKKKHKDTYVNSDKKLASKNYALLRKIRRLG